MLVYLNLRKVLGTRINGTFFVGLEEGSLILGRDLVPANLPEPVEIKDGYGEVELEPSGDSFYSAFLLVDGRRVWTGRFQIPGEGLDADLTELIQQTPIAIDELDASIAAIVAALKDDPAFQEMVAPDGMGYVSSIEGQSGAVWLNNLPGLAPAVQLAMAPIIEAIDTGGSGSLPPDVVREDEIPALVDPRVAAAISSFRSQQGIDIQRGTATPTTRSNGSPLQDGDLWADTTESITWYRSGALWVSQQLLTATAGLVSMSNGNTIGILAVDTGYNLLLNAFGIAFTTTGIHSSVNFGTLNLVRSTSNAGAIQNTTEVGLSTVQTGSNTIASGDSVRLTHLFPAGTVRDTIAGNGIHSFRVNCGLTGTPGTLNHISATLRYRLIKR